MTQVDPAALAIRTMALPELRLALDWAADEGWNPGLHDAACFFAADPNGFLVGELDGEPVACVSAVRYDDHFGFGGFYIAWPDMRGMGFGMRVWRAAARQMRGMTVGLDGVVAQQENYARSGFVLAYRHLRYEGIGGGNASEDAVPLAEFPFDAIDAYDPQLFPAPRPAFLRTWIAQPDAIAFGTIRDGRLTGYGVLRRCRIGRKIGPLFADNPEDAEALYAALAANAPDEPIYLDIPEPNVAARTLVEHHGMTMSFETARMYANGEVTLPVEREYGVTTLDLG